MNLPYTQIPNNLYRYSPIKELEHHSPFLKCGLPIVASFQREQYGKGG